MTEKEYIQLVERLQRDGLLRTETDSAQQQKSRTYFSEAYAYMHSKYKDLDSVWFPGWGVAWDHIRRLTLWSYGARTQTGMPDSKRKEANERAMRFIDQLMDFSEETQNEKE